MDDWVDELLERNDPETAPFPPGALNALASKQQDPWLDLLLDDLPEPEPLVDDDGVEM